MSGPAAPDGRGGTHGPGTRRLQGPRSQGPDDRSAKRVLKAAHCALGTVKRKHVKRNRLGKVIAQRPRKGKSLTKGAKVAVTVGKR